MADSTTTEKPPTIEDAQAVATAAGEAAQAEPTPEKAKASAAKAAQKAGDERNLALTPDDYRGIADAVVEALRDAGAFDSPPEPVTAPAAAPDKVEPAPGETDPNTPAPLQEGTGRRSFAQRYMGL